MKSKQLFFENLVAQNALGGIPVNYDFSGKTLYQIFEDLFSGGDTFTKVSLEDNAGLEFNLLSQLRTKYNTLVPDEVPSQPINKLPSKPASVWKTKTIVQVLDEILFPASLATYTPPTIQLSGSLTAPYYEVGSLQTNNLSLIGIKNDAGAYTNLSISRNGSQIASISNPLGGQQASQPQGSDYPNPNVPNYKYTLNHNDVDFEVQLGTNTWGGIGSYNPGLAKQNSDGTTDSRSFQERLTTNPQAGDNSFSSNNVSINGIYPYYYGYIVSATRPTPADIINLISNYTTNNASINKVLRPLTDEEEVYFNANSPVWMWIAHTGTAKTNYITKNQSNPTDITGTNLFNSNQITNFTTPYWLNVSFNLYIASSKSDTVGNYWFKFR